MNREQFEIIMEGRSKLGDYDDDNAYLGLQIVRKYLPKMGVVAAEHDIIYSANIDELINSGLKEEDAIELRNLNWMIDDDGDCLACFV